MALQSTTVGSTPDTVELIMALEEEFEIDIPDEDAGNIKTVGEIIKYIEDKTRIEGK